MNGTLKVGTRLAALLAIAVYLVGCGPPPKPITLKDLDVAVKDKPKLVKKSITSVTLAIPFRIINNNDVAVQLDNLGLDGTINGTSIGSNAPTKAYVIKSGGTSTFELIYHVSALAGGLGVADALVSGQLTLALQGSCHFESADGRFTGEKDQQLTLK